MKQNPFFRLGFTISLLGGFLLWHKLRPVRAAAPFWMKQRKPGTALITGASSGLGAAFARRLAAKGYDLMLVARRKDKLTVLANELKHRYPTRTDFLIADLAKAADVERLEKQIAESDSLSLLINNAGFGTQGPFAETDLDKQLDMIHVHLNASIRLCHAALPGMIDRSYGAIINVSSTGAFFETPGRANYCATKAYLTVFSQALQRELNGSGVYIQALCPGLMYTEFHDTVEYANFSRSQIPAYLWMPVDAVITESLNALGHNQVILVPGIQNRLIVLLAQSSLGPIMQEVAQHLMKSKQGKFQRNFMFTRNRV